MNAADPKVIVALDFANPMHALALADRLDPAACALKVGKELFVIAGPEPVRWMIARGFRVFLDLKFHDIPNTVAGACAAAARLGVAMMNVHASGGRAMLRAARDHLAHGLGPRAHEELLADLEAAVARVEAMGERKRVGRVGKIKRDEHSRERRIHVVL